MCSYYGTEAPILVKSGNPVASVRVKPASSHHGRLENETTQFLGFEGGDKNYRESRYLAPRPGCYKTLVPPAYDGWNHLKKNNVIT